MRPIPDCILPCNLEIVFAHRSRTRYGKREILTSVNDIIQTVGAGSNPGYLDLGRVQSAYQSIWGYTDEAIYELK
jgi:hypothetical protein